MTKINTWIRPASTAASCEAMFTGPLSGWDRREANRPAASGADGRLRALTAGSGQRTVRPAGWIAPRHRVTSSFKLLQESTSTQIGGLASTAIRIPARHQHYDGSTG